MTVKHEYRKQIKSVKWLIFWVVLAQFAANIAVQAAVSFMQNPPHEYIQIAICELLAVGVPIMVYGRSEWRGSAEKLKNELMLKRCGLRIGLIAAAIGITGQFIMMLLNMPVNIYIQTVLKAESADAIPVALSGFDIALGFVAVVILPAFLEEFWMRGLVFRAYNRCSTTGAVVFTSLVFALAHMRMNEFVGLIFMGFMAAYIMLRTKSLYAAIIYHAASNAAALLFGFVLANVLDYLWWIFGAATALFFVSIVLLNRNTKRIHKNKTVKAGKLVWRSIFSLPFILSVLVAVLRHYIV